jgi:hypothetical protein
MLAVAMGFGWWLGRRSAESESSLATTAHAGDVVQSASCACPSTAAAPTTVADLVTLSPVTHPASSATAAGLSTPQSTAATMVTTPTPKAPLTTPPPSAVKPVHPVGSGVPRTVVVLEPMPSPPRAPAPSAESAATAPPKPKAFEPAEP